MMQVGNQHRFRVRDAKAYGVTEAILLYNLRFWIAKNKASGKHWHELRTWTYNSHKEFSKLFPYLSESQIKRALASLVKQGAVVKDNFNKKPYDGYPARPLQGAKYNYEDEWAFDPHGMTADLQTAHGSPWDAPSGYSKPTDWVNEWYFNESTPINTAEAFSINYLIQSAR